MSEDKPSDSNKREIDSSDRPIYKDAEPSNQSLPSSQHQPLPSRVQDLGFSLNRPVIYGGLIAVLLLIIIGAVTIYILSTRPEALTTKIKSQESVISKLESEKREHLEVFCGSTLPAFQAQAKDAIGKALVTIPRECN